MVSTYVVHYILSFWSSFDFVCFPDFLNADEEIDCHEEGDDDVDDAGEIRALDNSGWSSRTRFQNTLHCYSDKNFHVHVRKLSAQKNKILFLLLLQIATSINHSCDWQLRF